jgi:hypothetical protein
MMSEQFTQYRTSSLTHPDNRVAMREGYAGISEGSFSREELEGLVVPLYEDDFLMKLRGEGRRQEQFVLQGHVNGEWVTIKEVSLLSGEGPEPDYGNCQDCGRELEESEFALGVICKCCLEKVHA